MVKTSISPPPPERPNSALLHLKILEGMVRTRQYERPSDRAIDLAALQQLRDSFAPEDALESEDGAEDDLPRQMPRRTQGPNADFGTGRRSRGGLFNDMFRARQGSEAEPRRRRPSGAAPVPDEPQRSSPGLTQLWQQVIAEIAMERRSLAMLLAQQSLLVSLQGETALVMVKQMWLPSLRKDAAVIEQELRSVLGRTDLKLTLKAAAVNAFEEDR